MDGIAGSHDAAAIAAVAQILHRMAGLSGTIGFPRVSVSAREFEDWLRDTPAADVDLGSARLRLQAVREAFVEDHAG
jgi:HPt (histidine-containing phosphotransfer) domain-containing protein